MNIWIYKGNSRILLIMKRYICPSKGKKNKKSYRALFEVIEIYLDFKGEESPPL